MTPSPLPLLALAPAALALPLIVASRRRPALREAWSVGAALAQTGLVALMVPPVLAGAAPAWTGPALLPGQPFTLRADPPAVLFGLVASALWVLTTVYSTGYTRALRERNLTRYFAAFALCLLATLGLALAGDLFTFFLFFELLTVAAYPLVVHAGSDEARRAGRVYLAYTLTGGSALLAAVAGTAAVAGRLDFVPGGFLRPDSAGPGTLAALLALFVLGCGVKAALVPLHTWLPAAMVAPTPVSALLHAVAVVKAGVFGLARVAGFVFGPATLETLGGTTALTWLALATVAFGSLAALAEDNLKRRLAFSTVSHLAYVVVGVGAGTSAAFAGALLHLGAHALLKITLFFCAGALHVGAHVERVSEMDGVGRRMPVTMGAFAVAAFLLAGLPPGAAFVSKWALLVGAADAHAWAAVAGLAASGLLNIAYFAPPVVRAFRAPAAPVRGEVPAAMVVPLVVTAAAGLLVGLAPAGWLPVLPLADRAATSVMVP